MDESRMYKTARKCNFSKRHFRRVIQKLTDEQYNEFVKEIENESADAGSSNETLDDSDVEGSMSMDVQDDEMKAENTATEHGDVCGEVLADRRHSSSADPSCIEEENCNMLNECKCTNDEFLYSDVSSECSFSESESCQSSVEEDDEIENVLNDSSDNDATFGNLFRNKLRQWALKFHISLIALTALLLLLQPIVTFNLPLDARTLLGTMRKVHISKMDNGEYYHFGLKRAVESILRDYEKMGKNLEEVKLVFNVDGLPIFKSSNESLWLILCSEINSKEVYPVGAYFGEKKPKDANDFIKEFVDELIDLCKKGLEGVRILFYALICDTPAKAFILYLKGHTGYDSCPKCCISGRYEISKEQRKKKKKKGRICFPGIGPFQLKTDEEFKNDEYKEVETGSATILKQVSNFGGITSVPLDYMHLVLLGVMKKLLRLWIMGPLKTRLSSTDVNKISKKLLTLRFSAPCEFARKPRSLTNFSHWKATEFRTFLLYTGPLALKNILPEELYENFIHFHCAVTLLVSKFHMQSPENINCAHEMFEQFVLDFQRIYGIEFVSQNVHNLLHLCADALRYGLLDQFSAFKFENYMTTIKRMIRKGDKPLEQIARRYSEKEAAQKNSLPEVYSIYKQQHNTGPLTMDCQSAVQQYKILKNESITIDCNNDKDRFILLKGGMFGKVLNIVKRDEHDIRLIVKPINSTGNLYDEPDSRSLNIHIGSFNSNELISTSVKNILSKVWRVPTRRGLVMLPLLH